jgi:histidinol phosphatase-like enzyme
MIGDKRSTEALEDILIRQSRLVGERSSDIEAGAEATVEFLEVRMQT